MNRQSYTRGKQGDEVREQGGGVPVMGWAFAGWMAGVAWQLQQEALLGAGVYGIALGLGVVLLGAIAWPGRKRHAMAPRHRWMPVGVAAVAAALAGWGWAGSSAVQRLQDRLPAALEGQDLVLTGVVAGLPQFTAQGVRFRFEVEHAATASATTGASTSAGAGVADAQGGAVTLPGVPRHIMLGWYAGYGEGALLAAPHTQLMAGQRWRLPVRLRQPHGSLNPHGFDVELWLFEQGIGATGSVRNARAAQAVLLDARGGHPVQALRHRVRDAIHAQVSDVRAAGVLSALVMGDQAAIEREDWDIFRITGVAHLMAISGLHVTMFAWLAAAAIRRLWRRSPRLVLAVPAPVAARWGGLLLATGYAVFAGWGLPAQRTVWMLAVVTLLAQAGRRWPWPMVLLAAAFAVTLFDPWALLQAGFWLSFVAVGLLLASDRQQVVAGTVEPVATGLWRSPLRHLRRLTGETLRTQFIATLGLAPLTLVFFHQISLVGFAANLIAIPLVTLVITPVAMLGMLLAPLWSLAAACVQALGVVLQWMAQWPGAQWLTPAAPGWAMAAGLLGGVIGVLPLPVRLRLLALPLLVPLLWPAAPRPALGSFEVIAADVGQGGAVIVRTARHTLLYDAGPRYSQASDAGQRVLLPLLQALGERRPDALVLSHQDMDHSGGLQALMTAYPGLPVWSSVAEGHALHEWMPRHQPCLAGQAWQWDGVRFEMLHPQPGDQTPPLKPNQVSCVLKVSSERHAALLSGDIERLEEWRLVRHSREQLAADLLLAPHHGSKTSSTAPFLDAVAPAAVVFQAGYRNRHGHPAAEVAARYDERGIERVETARCGAYRWSEGVGRCEREQRRRYWHHRFDAP